MARHHHARSGLPVQGHFVRGLVASACLSAIQDVRTPASPENLKRVLRHALQGGTALAAGAGTAAALERRDYTGALIATAAGVAGVLVIERLLREPARHQQENEDGQEA